MLKFYRAAQTMSTWIMAQGRVSSWLGRIRCIWNAAPNIPQVLASGTCPAKVPKMAWWPVIRNQQVSFQRQVPKEHPAATKEFPNSKWRLKVSVIRAESMPRNMHKFRQPGNNQPIAIANKGRFRQPILVLDIAKARLLGSSTLRMLRQIRKVRPKLAATLLELPLNSACRISPSVS